MFGFVAYQLWGTGIEYAQAQDRAENQFEELLGDGQRPSTTTPTTTSTAPTDDVRLGAGDRARRRPPTHDVDLDDDHDDAATDDHHGAVRRRRPRHRRRRWRRQASRSRGSASTTYVVAGVGREDLKKGPGHYPETPMPGQLGNSAIAGHRTTYGEPFFDLDELEPGDEIIVTTPTAASSTA